MKYPEFTKSWFVFSEMSLARVPLEPASPCSPLAMRARICLSDLSFRLYTSYYKNLACDRAYGAVSQEIECCIVSRSCKLSIHHHDHESNIIACTNMTNYRVGTSQLRLISQSGLQDEESRKMRLQDEGCKFCFVACRQRSGAG